MSGQLTLSPAMARELRSESLALEAIEGFDDSAPSAQLRELVRDRGLLLARSGRYRVVDGCDHEHSSASISCSSRSTQRIGIRKLGETGAT